MYISYIRLRNWKNFKDLEANVGWRVFIIGPNASGKSNLLGAFRFLRDVANDGLGKAVAGHGGGVSAIRSLAATRYSDILVEVRFADRERVEWQYRLAINQDKNRRPQVVEETVLRQGTQLLKRPNDRDRHDPLLLTQTALEQVSENQEFRTVSGFFGSISYQHLLPQVVRDPRGFSPFPVQNDPYGRDFLLRLWKTRASTRDSRLKKITAALRSAVPQLTELRVEMDDSGVPHLAGGYAHWRPRAAWQNESQFSDGTLRLLGLLWSAYEGSGPLLLEEPEISLHPEVVRRLPTVFHRINRGRKTPRQIIISTHSEAMLDDQGIAPEEVLCLRTSSGGTELYRPGEADRQAMAAGLSVADVLMPKAAPQNVHQLTLDLEP